MFLLSTDSYYLFSKHGCTECSPCPTGMEATNMGSVECTPCLKGLWTEMGDRYMWYVLPLDKCPKPHLWHCSCISSFYSILLNVIMLVNFSSQCHTIQLFPYNILSVHWFFLFENCQKGNYCKLCTSNTWWQYDCNWMRLWGTLHYFICTTQLQCVIMFEQCYGCHPIFTSNLI